MQRHDRSPAYLRLAREIENQIIQGAVHAGHKLPSVRALSRNRAVNHQCSIRITSPN